MVFVMGKADREGVPFKLRTEGWADIKEKGREVEARGGVQAAHSLVEDPDMQTGNYNALWCSPERSPSPRCGGTEAASLRDCCLS